jgi:hypothetical protein
MIEGISVALEGIPKRVVEINAHENSPLRLNARD